MEKQHAAKQKMGIASQAITKCPAEINALKTGVICCLTDGDLTIRWGNTGFFDSIGYSSEDFFNSYSNLRQYFNQLPDDFMSIVHALTQEVLDGDANIDMDIRLPLNAGGFAWMHLYGTVIKDAESGEPVLQAEFSGIDKLVAEKEEQSELCKQKLQYFYWMLDTYVGNIYVSDMETYELLYLNKNSCNILGEQQCKLLGKKCYEVIQGRTSPCPFCTNDKLSEDAFYEWEFYNPLLERTFMIKNRIVNWNGRRARIELSHDMFSAEYKLAQKDRERDALIRTIPGGFVRIDAKDMQTAMWYSGDFLRLIGYTKEQFGHELHSQCTYIYPEDVERTVGVMKKSMETGKSTAVEVRIITRNGTIKILTMTYSYVSAKNSWDGIASFYSVGIDITRERTEQERQRQALQDACTAAQIANDAKTNFLSSMSHDIRTPMNAIIGMTVIAQANLHSPEKVQDCLGKINSSSRHLLSLINEVLDMSKIESGKIDLISEPVSISSLLEDSMDVFHLLAAEKNQELQVNADHVRHEMIMTDGSRLQQVLVNLLSNAVKYTQNGGTISLRVRERPSFIKGRGQYEFIITDNGIGMTEQFIPHLFEPFSRADDIRINGVQGTGLGMAITQNIVRMMNGTIEVKSTLGQGSQFIVAVSFEPCQDTESGNEELSGLPVLVVDDDQIICESAAEILDELGMRSSWVLSGREAVNRVVEAHEKSDDFSFVIIDWMMPDMNGLETVKMIRSKLAMNVPIIIISSYNYSDIEDEFRLAGANAFISKPMFKSKMANTFLKLRRNEHAQDAAIPVKETNTSFNGKRILLVEDNNLNREIAAELLQMHGFVIDEAENGQIAVEKFQASVPGEYDCILMDIQMPVMDGYKATEAIRSLNRQDAKALPILALTANAFASDVGRVHSAGMNDHVAKPIDIGRLLETLQKWIK